MTKYKYAHNYVYIRAVGDVSTGEFVTIGIISLSKKKEVNVHLFKECKQEDKIWHMFGNKFLQAVQASRGSIKADVEHWATVLDGKEYEDYANWFKEYTKPREGMFQYSHISTAIFNGPIRDELKEIELRYFKKD